MKIGDRVKIINTEIIGRITDIRERYYGGYDKYNCYGDEYQICNSDIWYTEDELEIYDKTNQIRDLK